MPDVHHRCRRATPPRTRPIHHALLVVSTAALVGCGSGQVAQTALGASSVPGLNTENVDGSVLIRNLAVSHNGTAGYPAGGDAPLELHLFNQTTEPVTVHVGSRPPDPRTTRTDIVSARSVTLAGGRSAGPAAVAPSPAGNESEPGTAAPGNPDPSSVTSARIDLEPLGRAVYRPGGPETLQAVALTEQLRPGNTLNLTFTFSNGTAPLVVQAPIATPLSPAPREPAEAVPTS